VLQRVGSEGFVGPAVGIALVRELGPVLTAVFVTGLAGSALTAELGIMRISEQIDALMVMALNPVRYLVVPALLAGLISFPMLTAIFDVAGIYGGYPVPALLLGLFPRPRFGRKPTLPRMARRGVGVLESLASGVLVPWVCTYKAFHCGHGAEGVSRATTEAVVLCCVLILIFNYFLGSVLP